MKRLLSILALTAVTAITARAQGTAFSYQGFLTDQGAPANGVYDFEFRVFDAVTSGAQQGGLVTVNDLGITNGLFTVTIDPGAGVFTGAARWLNVAVRPGASAGAYTNVVPRQPITPAPYAVFSASAATLTGTLAASQLTGAISSNNIGAGSLTSVMLANGAVGSSQLAAGAVTTGALADGAVTAPKVATVQAANLSGTFAKPVPQSSENFGASVAAVGSDRVLVGATGVFGGVPGAGAAYLFSANGTLLTTITNPTPAGSVDQFGNAVMALGSDRLVIASFGKSSYVGEVYLYGTNGALLTTITNPTPAANDRFGQSLVAIGSDRVLIGADGDDNGTTDVGVVYLYNTNGTLLNTITNPAPTAGANFGCSAAVVVGSDWLLVGALGGFTAPYQSGTAYLLTTNGTLITTFTNPVPFGGLPAFGLSVAAVGSDRVLIGAHQVDIGDTDDGAAFLFSTNGTLLATITNPVPAAGDRFGNVVAALGGDRFLVGASRDDAGAADAGSAYLFDTNGALIATFNHPTPTNGDRFGNALAVLGTSRVAIGAFQADIGATDAGAAYLFTLESYAPGLMAESVRSGSITTASLADGAVTAAKIGGVLNAAQIPNLDASKITSGVLSTSQIPNLDASKITSGTVADARLSTNVALLNGGAQAFTGFNTFNQQLTVNNDLVATGVTRFGSGSGTSQAPDKGLILRRVRSTFNTEGQIVAATDKLTFVRDGSNAGFKIINTDNPGNSTIAFTGVTSSNTTVNTVFSIVASSAAGTNTVFTDAQDVIYLRGSFGDSYNVGHLTEVSLTRYPGDYYWTGTITSTFNQ